MTDLRAGDSLPLRIKAQNAGLIFRHIDDAISMECFELSARSEDVTTCTGRLRRLFPAHAVAIPLETFVDATFLEGLYSMLNLMDSEVVDEMMPQSTKAGSRSGEIRDTCHPGLVTELFMTMLHAVRRPVQIFQIEKRTRDDVLWKDSLLPWRRSPFWLVLRVSIQTTLLQDLEATDAVAQYKNFMVFFLTDLLNKASEHTTSNYLCKVLQLKIARRSAKLGARIIPLVLEQALSAVEDMDEKHKEIWRNIQAEDADRRTTVDLATLSEDTVLTLSNCQAALNAALSKEERGPQQTTAVDFIQDQWVTYDSSNLPRIKSDIQSAEVVYALAEFERWVQQELSDWCAHAVKQPCPAQCTSLFALASSYKDRAITAYSANSEQLSVMLLILGELWCALDRIATKIIPLLHRFPPEVPCSVFHTLLLPKKDQMQRLENLESHIRQRFQVCQFKDSSALLDPASSKKHSFSYQYYDRSTDHQALYQRIIADANQEREEKQREWQRKSDRHRSLTNQRAGLACETSVDVYGRSEHKSGCRKCQLGSEINSMRIDIHEWPLPKGPVQSRQAVFNLHCPEVVVAWRDMTWMLIQDLGRQQPTTGESPATRLDTYNGLSQYCTHNSRRIKLASATKSVMASHYRERRDFPMALNQLYYDHGPRWRLHDDSSGIWLEDQLETPSFSSMCQTLLTRGCYETLQYAIDSTDHNQNAVLASQQNCSPEMSLHEFVAYGSLRADGERTQWLNICRELTANNLSWNALPVYQLIRQAAWQTCSDGLTYLRKAHKEFEDVDFSTALLANVSVLLDSMRANRQSHYAMHIVIILLLRVHSLTADHTSIKKALDLLQECRVATFTWVCGLEESLRTAVEPEQISAIRNNLLRVALLCKMTFHAEKNSAQIMTSSDDVRFWASSSIVVQDNTPGTLSSLPRDLQELLLGDKKITHVFYGRLKHLLTGGSNAGLDHAITRIWSAFRTSAPAWSYLDGREGRWIYKWTLSGLQRASQVVSYNLISGELLIDGRPLGVLPKAYTSNPNFVRIFGAQILRVSASDMPGMPYMTANKEHGYTFYFGIHQSSLIIRAKSSSVVYEIVPHTHFTGDFPILFVEEYSHWLDLSTKVLEFRPLERRWDTEILNWQLIYQPNGNSVLQAAGTRMVDIRSQTCRDSLAVFGGLDRAGYMHITTSPDCEFRVGLPRLGLNFFLNKDGNIECQELRKIVDSDQSLGTLIGLKSRLVLCATGAQSRRLDRTVLIPKGDVSTTLSETHIVVDVSSTSRHVQCLRYQHNPVLERLDGDGSVMSRLYQAYLHALTSYMLPDPLTGLLGTEKSLAILEEQIIRCCNPLEVEEIDLLNQIGALTPQRTLYPQHLRVMQQVTWHKNLDPLLQHDDFASVTARIVAHSESFELLYHNKSNSKKLHGRGDSFLLLRARLRHAALRNPDSCKLKPVTDYDKDYISRDTLSQNDRASRVSQISTFIARWSANPPLGYSLADMWRRWGSVVGFDGTETLPPSLSVRLDFDLAHVWGLLYDICRHATKAESMYKLLFIFSLISYGSKIGSVDDLKVLLTFAMSPALQSLPPFHQHHAFTLNKGSAPDDNDLRSIISNGKKPFSLSRKGLTGAERQEEHEDWQKRVATLVRAGIKHFKDQWPCESPSRLNSHYAKLLNVDSIHEQVQTQFAEWFKNLQCEGHLASIQSVLDSIPRTNVDQAHDPSTWLQVEPVTPIRSLNFLPRMLSLMKTVSPVLPSVPSIPSEEMQLKAVETSLHLRSLIANLGATADKIDEIRRKYKADLEESVEALQNHLEPMPLEEITQDTKEKSLTHLRDCEEHYMRAIDLLRSLLEPSTPGHRLLKSAGLWPRLCSNNFLGFLASTSPAKVSQQWKESLGTLGLCMTIVQRSRRLVLAAEKNDVPMFFKETENPGHEEWDAIQRPDWLLIEIENNLLIRPIQIRVALEMIEPSQSCNALMQLNMGEGKSSVITPLIATAIANSEQLARIVVLRSLTRQMQDTMIQRLGGLVRRPVYFMPFSRKTNVDEATISRMRALYSQCMKTRGVLIAQPEHILSFKLMGRERLVSGDSYVSKQLLETQLWLDDHCRDVLDESDEILDVKFQLVYTLGAQRGMDGQPDRWLMMQAVFDLVKHQVVLLQAAHPKRIEVEAKSSSSFPAVRLLSAKISQELMSAIGQDICASKIPGLVLSNLSPRMMGAATNFIILSDVSMDDCKEIELFCKEDEVFLKKLLFVRGLVSSGILLHALHDHRWSVTYGLHRERCFYAVPYRAKGVPAPSAEFGHPDVAIALTCLSYYYDGLEYDQVRRCLELVKKADDPTAEYETWTSMDPSFPAQLIHWSAVNLEDQQQCKTQLYPALRYNKKTADFFLTFVVFPKEGKEYDRKLSASGWDIPARPESAKVTTGFSGTNDNRFLLPTTISQQDLPELRHTSGKVLEFLSREENLSYFCAKNENGVQTTTKGLLEYIGHVDPTARVLIDVGAQIIDFTNRQVIAEWLNFCPSAEAGIYFDEKDYPMVLTKTGGVEKLASSSFVNRMDRCIVYLDDVHTRGSPKIGSSKLVCGCASWVMDNLCSSSLPQQYTKTLQKQSRKRAPKLSAVLMSSNGLLSKAARTSRRIKP
ncbi:MAG: hypothetical protein Q9183_001709 [Haloplaca sp. 2 TL-2023]